MLRLRFSSSSSRSGKGKDETRRTREDGSAVRTESCQSAGVEDEKSLTGFRRKVQEREASESDKESDWENENKKD